MQELSITYGQARNQAIQFDKNYEDKECLGKSSDMS